MKNDNKRIVIDTIADPEAAKVIRLDAARAAKKAVMSHLFNRAVRAADESARRVAADREAQSARAGFILLKNS